MPNRENTEIIPEDSVKHLYKCLYEDDPSMAQGYKDGFNPGNMTGKNAEVKFNNILKGQDISKSKLQNLLQNPKLQKFLKIITDNKVSVDFNKKELKIYHTQKFGGNKKPTDSDIKPPQNQE